MVLKLNDKKAIVEDVLAIAKKAHSAVVVEYRGLTVEQMTELRKEARKANVYLKVVRNTLAKRALEDTDFKVVGEVLQGPVLLAFSMEDPGSAARLIKDYLGKFEIMKLKAVAISKQLFTENKDLERIAKLPTRDEALAMLMGTMKAPANKLAATLRATYAGLVYALSDLQKQKQV